jgi:hypothetical protein
MRLFKHPLSGGTALMIAAFATRLSPGSEMSSGGRSAVSIERMFSDCGERQKVGGPVS